MRIDRWKYVVVRQGGPALGFAQERKVAARLACVLDAEVLPADQWAADAARAEAEARAAEREAVASD